MTRIEIYACLRDLQVVPMQSELSDDRITELLEKRLIERKGRTKTIWLTTTGVHTKTGEL